MDYGKAFFERRLRDELTRAETVISEDLRFLHQRWVNLYRDRLAALSAMQVDIAA